MARTGDKPKPRRKRDDEKVIEPQPRQAMFLGSTADIAIFGGAAFGGKTFALLMEPLRHLQNPFFTGTIFRRTTTQVRQQGGLWDTSQKLYPFLGGRGYTHNLSWRFESGMRLSFAHMEHPDDRFNWKGSQIPFVGFDQLEDFESIQFWYMLSRNRSSSGVPGYVRATCNPDPDSWLRHFIGWWIDDRTGYAIDERAGKLRWFIRIGDALRWADTKDELGPAALSVTFIPALPEDNPVGMSEDPTYIHKLDALLEVEKEQLKKGNWNIRPTAGAYFPRSAAEIVEAAPTAVTGRCRGWDRAATKKSESDNPDGSAGVKISRDRDGVFYVEHVETMFEDALGVEKAILSLAPLDGQQTAIFLNQDPGAAGKGEAKDMVRKLAGYNITAEVSTGSKEVRATAFARQWQARNVKLVRGAWNDAFLTEMENFPVGKHDDQVDAAAYAFNHLMKPTGGHAQVGKPVQKPHMTERLTVERGASWM